MRGLWPPEKRLRDRQESMADKRHLRDSFARAAKKPLVAALLAGTMLSGCASTLQPETSDPFSSHRPVAATTFQQNLEGRSLTADTEAIFKRNAPKPVNDNWSEDRKVRAYIEQLCFSGQSAAKPEQEEMRKALERLARLPLTGRPLVEMAVRENVQFCNIPHLPAGMGAQYVPTLGAVLAPGERNENIMVLHLAHELLHAAQDKNDLLVYQYDWDIHSRLSRNLSIEAAAITFELLVAFEAKQAGDDTLWKYLSSRFATQSAYGDAGLYTLADEQWKLSKDAGKDDKTALGDVGRALWTRMFDNQGWLQFYLNFELASYMRDITSGALDKQASIRESGYSQLKTDAAGKIGDAPSFTQGGRVPPLEKLLSGNDKIRQAYAAVDLERHRRSLGEDHPVTKELRQRALADANPYLNLDFGGILKKMRENAFPDAEGKKKFAYLHEYMDAAIGRAPARLAENAPAPASFPFIAPAPLPPDAQGKPASATPVPILPPPPPPSEGRGDTDMDAPRPVPPRDTLAQRSLRHLPPAA